MPDDQRWTTLIIVIGGGYMNSKHHKARVMVTLYDFFKFLKFVAV